MKIWFTAPFDDDGIRVGELIDYSNGILRYTRGPFLGIGAYVEGVDWHRTYQGAVDGARKRRADRIERAIKEIAHVNALPPVPDHVGGSR